jgi:hypothetical protein
MPEHDHDFNRNVRFWITGPGCGLVKITLRPEQTVEFMTGGKNEEGFAASSDSFYYDARRGVIECTMNQWGRDCDGRYELSSLSSCPVGDEQRIELQHDGSDRCWGPRWRQETQSQRDMTAEAMGY